MLKKWARYIGSYRRDAVLAPALVSGEVILDILIPLLMAHMIDAGITAGNMTVILQTGMILVAVGIVSLGLGVVAGRFSARAAAGFAKNLRRSLFGKIQDFSFHNIDKFSTTSLVTRLTTDVASMQNALQMILRICIRAPLMIIFSVVMVLSINAQLAWIFIVIIPVLGGGLVFIISRAFPLFTKVFKLYDRLNTVVQENVRGIRVVKSYVREEHEVEKFKKASGDIYENFVRAERVIAFSNPLMQSCVYCCTLLICWLGAQMIVAGTFTTGQLMSLLAYAMQILISLMLLSMVLVMVTMSRTAARRISEVLEEPVDMPEGHITEVPNGSVRLSGVSFGYRGSEGELCLRDIDIDIPAGQTVGIIGGTGSGKSTLAGLIPRLYDVTGGSLEVGGHDVRDYKLEVLRGAVAVVLQKNVLFSGTIKDNLRWGKKDATDEEMIHVCELAQADEFIRAFPDGYDTWIEQGGSNVSGGQKQRLCIARALLKRPKILILDDSTSAVDTQTDALIRRAFREEIPDTTKIIIAQRVSSVQDADQIIVMDDGRVCATGTHDTLLETSLIYREVYESQQKGGFDNDAAC